MSRDVLRCSSHPVASEEGRFSSFLPDLFILVNSKVPLASRGGTRLREPVSAFKRAGLAAEGLDATQRSMVQASVHRLKARESSVHVCMQQQRQQTRSPAVSVHTPRKHGEGASQGDGKWAGAACCELGTRVCAISQLRSAHGMCVPIQPTES